jgi:hypothetical protein
MNSVIWKATPSFQTKSGGKNMNHLCLRLSAVVLTLLLQTGGLSAQVARAAAPVVKSSVSTEDVKYLGDGFNTVQKDYVYGNMALEFPDGALVYEGVSSESKYCFVSSKKDLEEQFFSNFSEGIGGSFLGVTAKTDITKTIEKSTSFSAEKITIVAYWKQIDKKVYSNGLPKLKDSALTILQNDPKRFMQLYGDRYINGVTLGKMFYIVYQADISGVVESNRSSVTKAVELSYKKIAGGSLTETEEKFMSEKLTNVKIESKSYASGLSGFIGPYSADDFKNIQYQVGQSQSTPIEITLKDYSYTSNYGDHSFFDSSKYYKMADEWEQHLSMLKYITSCNRISSSLMYDCTTAYNNATKQLELVYALDSDARYPSLDISTFNVLYNRYVTELQIAQRWYELPETKFNVVKTKTIDLDFSSLGDVETIKIERFSPFPGGTLPGGVFGFFKFKLTVKMYYFDGNNLSLVKTVEYQSDSDATIYEGVKSRDKYRLSFSYKHDGLEKFIETIKSSYLEKMTDVIWLYLKDNGLINVS